jgi:hypothetical protein
MTRALEISEDGVKHVDLVDHVPGDGLRERLTWMLAEAPVGTRLRVEVVETEILTRAAKAKKGGKG